MKVVEGQTFITIGELAKKIGRTPQTLKNWISWYESQDKDTQEDAPLPEANTDLDTKGTRYFKEVDVTAFKKFRDLIKYGDMSDFSITRWGEYGKELQAKRKEESIK